MMTLSNHLQLIPPAGFAQEEVVTSYRAAPPVNKLKAPLAMQFQATPRPNLIVTRRAVEPGTALPALMSGLCTDLVRYVEGASAIEAIEFKFRDGAIGLLLKYTVPIHEHFKVLQLQAGRVDDGVFTLLTLSMDPKQLNDEQQTAYLDCIASASVAAGPGVAS